MPFIQSIEGQSIEAQRVPRRKQVLKAIIRRATGTQLKEMSTNGETIESHFRTTWKKRFRAREDRDWLRYQKTPR
jgi:hypothetical protein